MFVDSLDALHTNSSQVNSCLLSSSELEVRRLDPAVDALNVESETYNTIFLKFPCLMISRKGTVIVGYWNSSLMSGLIIVQEKWFT